MHSLPVFLRLSGRPVMLVGAGEAADAKRRLLERAGALVVREDDAAAGEARIAIVALDDESEAAAVAGRLKARGMLVNVVDRPALCDFTLPAIVERDPVLMAVGTGGASAGLAAALRQRLEALLPPHLGDLARGLSAAREAMRARWPDGRERRQALAQALAPGGLLDPLDGIYDVDEWLASGHARPSAGLYSLHLRSPDPDDLTLRDARRLAMADRILHPPGTPPAILDRARADAERIALPCDRTWSDLPGLSVVIDITAL